MTMNSENRRSSYFFISSCLFIVVCIVAHLTTVNGNEARPRQEKASAGRYSSAGYGIESDGDATEAEHPRTLHELFSRLQRSSSARAAGAGLLEGTDTTDGDRRTCVIEVPEIRRIPGECIRLLGGASACRGEEYLDPVNEACS